MIVDTPWVRTFGQPQPHARLRLLCLPHAGSAAATYAEWAERLSPHVDVWAVEYPGRGARRGERPFVRVHVLVAALVAELLPTITTPFAIFGHSMGALIGFELARRLRRAGGVQPTALITAACRAPSLPHNKPPVFALPEAAFLDELQALNGTPPHVLADENFARVFLPMLRADFEMADTYVYRPAGKLDCEVIVLAGADDVEAPVSDMAGWAEETNGRTVIRSYPGDHFFLHTSRAAVLEDLSADLLAFDGVATDA